jgi:hypothetical protein
MRGAVCLKVIKTLVWKIKAAKALTSKKSGCQTLIFRFISHIL